MLRILHVHSGNMFGGVERVLLSLLEAEQAAGASTPLHHEFALCFPGEFERLAKVNGGTTHTLEPVQSRNPWTVFRARRKLRRILREHRFDVLMTHSTWAQAIFGGLGTGGGPIQAFWLHDVIDGKHWLQRWAALKRPDVAIANSSFTAGGHRILYPNIDPAVVYCPAAPIAAVGKRPRTEVRRRLGIVEEAVVIAQVGRLEPLKGHRTLVEALATIAADPRWVCLQITSANTEAERQYQNELRELAAGYGIGARLRFVDPEGDVPSLLYASDIYCQPNLGPEGFGLTLVEALQAGLPVVTSELGGAIEAVEGHAWLIEPGNAELVGKALSSLVGDPELRSRFAAAGREHARRITDPASRIRDLTTALNRRSAAIRN